MSDDLDDDIARQHEIVKQIHLHRRISEAGAFSLFIPSDFQRPWFQTEKKITTLIKGNQVGGTTCAVVRMLAACLGTWPLSLGGVVPLDWNLIRIRERPGMYLLMGQSFTKTIPEIILPKLREFIHPSMLSRKPKKHPTGVPYIFYFKSGAELHLGSYDQPAESFEGPLWNGICFDEPPPREIYISCRRGTMRTKGWIMFTMTPLKNMWVYDEVHLPAMNGKLQDVAAFEAHSHLNCVLDGTRIGGRITGGLKARYSGECVEIQTKRGNRVSVTVNHPVLTTIGIRAAGDLCEGEYVLCHAPETGRTGSAIGQVQHEDASNPVAEEVFDLLRRQGEVKTHRAAVHLDGDERLFDADEVHLVGFLARGLREVPGMRDEESACIQLSAEIGLVLPDRAWVPDETGTQLSASPRFPGAPQVERDLGRVAAEIEPPTVQRFGRIAEVHAPLPKAALDSLWVAMDFARELRDRFPRLVTTDQVVNVRHFDYSGHVYDFSTDVGYFASNNLLSRNCRTCNPGQGHIDHHEMESFFATLSPAERRARELGIPLNITNLRYHFVQADTHVTADIW